jgi:hypothetical protein
MAFHRLLFFADSPDTPWPANAGELSVFSAKYETRAALDLTRRAARSRPRDLAASDRLRGVPGSRRRRPDGGHRRAAVRIGARPIAAARRDIAILACGAFAARRPAERQTWRMHLGTHGVRAVCDWPEQRIGFEREAFASDPRIASLRWLRDAALN